MTKRDMDDHMQRAQEMLEEAMGCAIEHNLSGQVSMHAALDAVAAALRSHDHFRDAAKMIGQAEAAQVSDVTRQLIERDQRGAAKYGTTLDRTDLRLPDWLQHMAEELMDAAGYALAAKRTAEAAQAVPEGLTLKLGIYGSAYDKHGTCRAFTYEHQPGNTDAYKLGRVAFLASRLTGGDSIDYGLGLLKILQEHGFGVFQIAAAPKPEQAP